MTLQTIIRPFESRDTSPAILPPPGTFDPNTSSDPLVLEWGKSWQLATANGSISIDASYYAVNHSREQRINPDDRELRRKRIFKPGEDTATTSLYVDIPVIYSIKAKTIQEFGQERHIHFSNSDKPPSPPRRTRTVRVYNTLDPTQYVDVERPLQLTIEDYTNPIQYSYVLTNNDPPPIQADGSDSPSHEEKHIVRYFKDNNTSATIWVDVELQDKVKFKESERGQEWIYHLVNDELGEVINDPDVPYEVTVGYCDMSLELVPPPEPPQE